MDDDPQPPVTGGPQPATTPAMPLRLRSGKTLTVRPFDFTSVADYEKVVAIDNASTRNTDSVENWMHWDANRNRSICCAALCRARWRAVAFGH